MKNDKNRAKLLDTIKKLICDWTDKKTLIPYRLSKI